MVFFDFSFSSRYFFCLFLKFVVFFFLLFIFLILLGVIIKRELYLKLREINFLLVFFDIFLCIIIVFFGV